MSTGYHGVREPAVAGMFYPSEPSKLASQVDDFLASVDVPAGPGRPRLLVSPHAGYPYSGRIAAHGFQAVRAADIRTIVLIGPSHVEYFDHSAVFDGDGYRTPLGVLPVDHALVENITRGRRTVRRSTHGHVQPQLLRGEHALEVQLPFVQRTLPDVAVVPVVMGDQGWEYCRELGEALAEHCDAGVLILASSDLSHFYGYEQARRLDATFCEVLVAMDAPALYDAVRTGRCEACGAGPVIASLLAVEAEPGRRCDVLESANSGDVTGDRARVVGYASALVTAESS